MDRLSSMEAFVRVVESGSFVAAAQRLGISQAMVSRYVQDLEARLGTRLLQRSTRRLSLTEAGAAYFERSQQVLRDVEEMDASVASHTQQPRGTLRLNAPVVFGSRHLSRLLPEYSARFPEVTVDLSLSDRFIDLAEEGVDLALRIGTLGESSLVARRLCPVRLVICGSPTYFARHGRPRTPEDLAKHNCLGYTYTRGGNEWPVIGPDGPVNIPVRGSLRANHGEVLYRAAIDGLGLVLQPTFIAGEALENGQLEAVMPDYRPAELSAYAVFLSRKFLSAKVRTFVDFLADRLGPEPYWDRWQHRE
ncbi:MAG: LysR family transcriptional regulator [Burkholderiales bacterium]|nr:LysR family transcriptional regulator [Burkholderiales bacterium]